MELITITVRTSKDTGTVKLRFRLRDGRKVEMYHKSDIMINVADLDRLTNEGLPKPKVTTISNDLLRRIKQEKTIMSDAYALMKEKGLDMSSDIFEQIINQIKYPVEETRKRDITLLERFKGFADDELRDGIISPRRHSHYIVVINKLDRFLHIKGISRITACEFSDSHLMDFRNFLFDEYLYVNKYKHLYRDVSERNKPKERLSINTVSEQMKILQTLFTELENTDEIVKSPFRKLGKERHKTVMHTLYDEPFFLRKEELLTIIETEVSDNLKDTKNAFLVQCALGCRIGDFQRMGMQSIAVSEEGIPYVHYFPRKTAGHAVINKEIQTPIVRFAFEIIKASDFSFKILKNISGYAGYNKKIKELLEASGISRLVAQYDEAEKSNNYVPLYSVGSSKLGRKTHVDIMNKVQIDMYAAGLHKSGSTAVKRYTNMELHDRFALMNIAFGQEPYIVDDELNLIS